MHPSIPTGVTVRYCGCGVDVGTGVHPSIPTGAIVKYCGCGVDVGTGVHPSIPTGVIVRYCGCEFCVCLTANMKLLEYPVMTLSLSSTR